MKPENIVIRYDVLKIIDFANSIIIKKEDLINKNKNVQIGISKQYAAPEIIMSKSKNKGKKKKHK